MPDTLALKWLIHRQQRRPNGDPSDEVEKSLKNRLKKEESCQRNCAQVYGGSEGGCFDYYVLDMHRRHNRTDSRDITSNRVYFAMFPVGDDTGDAARILTMFFEGKERRTLRTVRLEEQYNCTAFELYCSASCREGLLKSLHCLCNRCRLWSCHGFHDYSWSQSHSQSGLSKER